MAIEYVVYKKKKKNVRHIKENKNKKKNKKILEKSRVDKGNIKSGRTTCLG